ETLLGIETGADGGPALRQELYLREDLLQARDSELDLCCIAGELLAEGERRRVLGVRAPDLDDAGPGARLLRQRLVEVLQGRKQPLVDLERTCDVHGRREGVIRGLREVDVIVGIDGLLRSQLSAEHLDG